MVTRSERRWALWFGVAAAVVTALPYLAAYQVQGDAWRFSGYLFGVEDGNSYTAKMLLGASGAWLFRTPYTPYPQGGVLAFLPYLLLGKLTAPPGQHEQLIALFQLFRAAATVLFGLAAYDFLALFTGSTGLRRLGTALAVLGGGLGWLALLGLGWLWRSSPLGVVLPGMDLPMEFYSPETFGFLMVFGLPHLAAARALLLWGLRDYLRPPESGLRWARPGLLWLLMGLLQPLTVISGWAVLAAHVTLVAAAGRLRAGWSPSQAGAVLREYVLRAARIGLLSAPVVIYTFLAFRLDPFLRGWESQNRIVSPPFHHYLLAFGLVLVLALWGVRPLWRGSPGGRPDLDADQQGNTDHLADPASARAASIRRAAGWLPLAWAAAFPLLAYAPYNLQRRLPDGIWMALLALALAGIERGMPPAGRRWALRGLVSLGFLTTLLVYAGAALSVLNQGRPVFRPAAEVRAFEALAAQARPGDLVLAAYETGNALPAYAPVRVFVGLGPESINRAELDERIACFYGPDCANSEREALLADFDARYVWSGPAERALGGFDPGAIPVLELVYREEGYEIYRRR